MQLQNLMRESKKSEGGAFKAPPPDRIGLNGSLLHSDNLITYLGKTLTVNATDHNINTRIQAARRAYYGLQSSGVCCDGVTPKTLSRIYKVGIQPILTYECSAVNIDHNIDHG